MWSRLARRLFFLMLTRRARDAEMEEIHIGCHTFRATGITPAYLDNGGTLENVAAGDPHHTNRIHPGH
jgi:hypothetical protein